jgi:hypothetical protein
MHPLLCRPLAPHPLPRLVVQVHLDLVAAPRRGQPREEAALVRDEEVRCLRAVGALERMGGPEARAVLAGLARGAAEARIPREAKQALERLGPRAGS